MNTSNSWFGRISARSSLVSKDYKASIQLLDDNETINTEYKRNALGSALLDYVCESLDLVEKDYFGLRFQDANRHRYWVDTSKAIAKQVPGAENVGLRFRVRYYPADPSILKEEITRYQLFVQLQRDLLHGRLYCPPHEATTLGALILQSELGDFDPAIHKEGYVCQYKLFLKQTAKLEEKVAEEHAKLKGLTPAEAETRFLQWVSTRFDTYGYDPYSVKDAKHGAVYIGATPRGVLIFRGPQKIHQIAWNELHRVDYLGKELRLYPTSTYCPPMEQATPQNTSFNGSSSLSDKAANGSSMMSPASLVSPPLHVALHLQSSKSTKRGDCLKFTCPSATFAKHLWRHLLSQQVFFTERTANSLRPKFSKPRIPLLTRGSTFRYSSNRVLNEMDAVESRPVAPRVMRYPLPRQEPRQAQPWLANKFNTMPALHSNGKPSHKGIMQEVLHEDPVDLSETAPSPDSFHSESIIDKDKVTTFTIHLSRTEPSSNTDSNITSTFKPILESNGNLAHPPKATSTPIASRTPVVDSTREPALHSKPSAPGIALHSKSSSPSIALRITNLLFTLLLVFILMIAVLVCLFETGDPAWTESTPLAHVRHAYYEPARRYLVARVLQ